MTIVLLSLNEVRDVVVEALGIEDAARISDASTPLLGNIPELDSFAVVGLVAALEQRFGIDIDDSALTGEVFETLGSLAGFIDDNRRR